MLAEFQPDGMFFKYLPDDLQTIDFNGFKHFINCYFGAELPADLIQQLFLSFAQSPAPVNGVQGLFLKRDFAENKIKFGVLGIEILQFVLFKKVF